MSDAEFIHRSEEEILYVESVSSYVPAYGKDYSN